MTQEQPQHVTVLLEEAVQALNIQPNSVVVDCTFGAGGHAYKICTSVSKTGRVYAIDADVTAFAVHDTLPEQLVPVVGNFRDITSLLAQRQVAEVDAILADLGWRTDQFLSANKAGGKGFSFSAEEPLLMTYGDPERYTFTAHDVVNTWEQDSLETIIQRYGEERWYRRIATAIIVAREQGSIDTAAALAEIVKGAIPKRFHGRTHPATKTFQAIRIAVNDELGALETLLTDGFALLKPGGRMAIITFHSLEDRVVKHCYKELIAADLASKITKKPITPSDEERTNNPRARSAKLRIIEKLTP